MWELLTHGNNSNNKKKSLAFANLIKTIENKQKPGSKNIEVFLGNKIFFIFLCGKFSFNLIVSIFSLNI